MEEKMFKSLKVIQAALFAALMIFASCDSGGGHDYFEGNADPEYFVEGLKASSSENYDFILDKTNILPSEKDGTFTVFVKNVKPQKLNVKSSIAGVKFSASAFKATSAEDKTGEGAWKSVVSYSISESLTEAVDDAAQFFIVFSTEEIETIFFKANVKVSFCLESENYKLVGAVQDEKNMAEHSVTVNWSYPSGIEVRKVEYTILQVGEEDGETTYKEVEKGDLENDAVTLTSKTNLAGKSNYCVKIKVTGVDGWYETLVGSEGAWVTTTDDITPPIEPNVVVLSTEEEAITLKYTKGDSSDDTVRLTLEVTCSNTAVPVPAMTAAVENYGDNGLDVSAVEAGASLDIVIKGLTRSTSANEYSIKVSAYDACNNTSEGSSKALTASTKADTQAPVVSSSEVNVVAGLSSAKITWTNPGDSDFASVSLKKGGEVIADNLKNGSYVLTSLTESATYALCAKDKLGNVHTTGTEVVVNLVNFTASAEVKYTGSVLVSWDDVSDFTADGEEINYTYEITGDNSFAGVTKESGIEEAHLTGLTVGTSYTFTVNVKKDSSTVASKALDAVKAKTVIWTILSGYGSNRYLSWAVSKNSTPCYNTAAIESKNAKTYYWIVRPALNNAEGYFTLEACSNQNGQGTGYYLYYDTNSRPYVEYNGTWGAGSGSPYAMVASVTGAENSLTPYLTDTSCASFKFASSVKGASWNKLVCEKDGRYIQHASLTYSMKDSSTSEDKEGCGAFKVDSVSYAETDSKNQTVSSVTDVSVSSDSPNVVNITWTNPENSNIDYVKITEESKSIDLFATGTSKSVTRLIGNTTYSFKITAYDAYGNSSTSVQADSVTTANGSDAPTNANAFANFTNQIVVTWEDATNRDDYTYTVEVTSSGSDTVSSAIVAHGVEKAVFNNLVTGNTYTFTLKSSVDGSEYSYSGNLSAVAAEKKVNLVNGGNHYLQVKSDNVVAFWGSKGNQCEWIVMPSLADENNSEQFSLKSAAGDKWLICDTNKTYVSGEHPAGNFDFNNNKNVMILNDKPSDEAGCKLASFEITDPVSGASGYFSALLVSDKNKYLREWWAISQFGAAQTGNDVIYSSYKFVDVVTE